MPEGPEIHRAADRIRRVLEGRIAARVWFKPPALAPAAQALTGQRIVAVAPRGKALLTRFDGGLTFYSHNQLYGRWIVTRDDAPPATTRDLRAAFATDRGTAWLYSASDLALLDSAALVAQPYLSRLGPDLLDPTLTPETVAARLDAKAFRGRSLAALLLDQGFIAGIGNYLRSEMLLVAGIAPERRASELSNAERALLARAVVDVGRQALRLRGVTNDADRAARLKAEGVGFEARRFHVFGREGLPCWTCGDAVERIEIGSRRLYVCRTCQR